MQFTKLQLGFWIAGVELRKRESYNLIGKLSLDTAGTLILHCIYFYE